MEEPFKGNALIEHQTDGIQITIPSDKGLGQSVFLGFWIIIWACGLFFGVNAIWGGPILLILIFLIWIILWIIAGLFAVKLFLWSIFGKEMLIVRNDSIAVAMDVPFFGNSKIYDLGISKNFRVKEDDYKFYGVFANRKNDFRKILPEGRIRFDYGMKTVKFAGGIDEAEAKHILFLLKENNFLQAKHFEK